MILPKDGSLRTVQDRLHCQQQYIDEFTRAETPDIQILEPVEEMFQPDDPSWEHVQFEPPTRATTPSVTFSSSSDSSRFSRDSSSDSEIESLIEGNENKQDKRMVRKRKYSGDSKNTVK